ncbi:MAG: response regulator [Thiohalocapsa sp.]
MIDHAVVDGSGKGLLLVEDDGALRQMLEWELTDRGYSVRGAGTCADARMLVQDPAIPGRFSFALIDLDLPDGRGTDLALELLRGQHPLRAILISGAHGADSSISAAMRRVVLDFLPKPIDVAMVDRLFRRCQVIGPSGNRCSGATEAGLDF